MQDFRVKTFLAVCRTLNYTRAAEGLALTRPAGSQHITYREREYGAKLFTYHRKKLELTPAGRVLRDGLATMAHDDVLLHERIEEVAHGATVKLRIGMTLTESVTYDDRGYPMENSLFQYKIPARVDIGKIRVEFENSYEGEGPFGAKSIGEVVINTPLPAISDAIRNAVGKRFYELPITPEKIAMAALEKK